MNSESKNMYILESIDILSLSIGVCIGNASPKIYMYLRHLILLQIVSFLPTTNFQDHPPFIFPLISSPHHRASLCQPLVEKIDTEIEHKEMPVNAPDDKNHILQERRKKGNDSAVRTSKPNKKQGNKDSDCR
jgi:hypothetical protein